MVSTAPEFEDADESPIVAEIINSVDDTGEPSGVPNMPEDEASWIQDRPPLSVEIVDNPYNTNSLVIATQLGPNRDHLVPTSYQDGKDDWYTIKAFEGELVKIAASYPIRVGRLRELAFALSAADARLKLINALIDEERRAVNRRNNEINQQVKHELEKLRIDYAEKRSLLARTITETENDRIGHKQSRQKELDSARSEYWVVRTEACAMRDARIGYIRETRNQLNEADKAHAENLRAINKAMIEDDIARLTARIEKLTTEIDEKQDYLAKTRFEISNDLAATRANAQELYQDTLEKIEAELDGQRAKLVGARDQLFETYQSKIELMNNNIHRFREEAIKLSESHSKELAKAKGQFERLEAKSSRGAIGHTDDYIQQAVLARASRTEHIVPMDNGPMWQIWLQKLYETALLLVTGGLFGISLGLVFGFIKTGDITKGKHPLTTLVFGTVGLAIFATIEKVVTQVWTFVAERNGSVAKADTNSAKTISVIMTVVSVAFAVLITVGLIALETYVEYQGIGRYVTALNKTASKGQATLKVDNLTLIIVSSIISVPFILYHSISGFRRASYHQAEVLRQAAAGDLLAEQTILNVIDEAEHAMERISSLDYEPDTETRTAEYWEGQLKSIIVERDNSEPCQSLTIFDESRINVVESNPKLQYLRSVIDRTPDDLQIENVAISDKESNIERIRTDIQNTQSQLNEKRSTLLSLLPPSADLDERGIVPFVNDVVIAEIVVDGDFPKLPTDASAAEVVAYQKWNSLRRAIGQDPTVVYYNKRIKSLQSAIQSLDVRVGKERKLLKDRERSIEVRIFQSEANQKQDTKLWAFCTQAQSDLINAQAHYNEEQECLRRLVEAPRFLRWIEHIRQYYFYKNSTQRQLDARKRINEIPPSEPKKLPSNEVKQLPSKD